MIVSEEAKKKPKVCLSNWGIMWNGCLYGAVTNHPNFEDGDFIRTSKPVAFDHEGKWIETKNTIYILGVPACQ